MGYNMSMVEDHTVQIMGLRVSYRTAGDPARPPVILLNGWGAQVSGFIFNSERVIWELANRGYRVYSPEHPGLMRSETPKTVWGFQEYARYVGEFIRTLDIKKPVLIGQSFGGTIATAYAYEYSDKLAMLILVNSALSQDKKRSFAFGNISKAVWHLHFLRSRMPALLKKYLVWGALGVPWGHIEHESFETRAIMGEIFRHWYLKNSYDQIHCPTAFVWGRYDMLFPLHCAKEVAAQIPGAKLYTTIGGHSVLYTQPKKIVALIIRAIENNPY